MASAGTTNSQRDNRRVRQRAGNKKNRTAHRRVRNARGDGRPPNHPAYQRDERQIDTGCFKTSAIDNRNRSGVAVTRGFRVNLAPHSLPRSSLTLFALPPSHLPRVSLFFPPLLFIPSLSLFFLSLSLVRQTRLVRPLVHDCVTYTYTCRHFCHPRLLQIALPVSDSSLEGDQPRTF